MTIKKQLSLPVALLLLTQVQATQTQYISANYFHTSTLQVVGFFAASAGIAKLWCPEFGRQNTLQGRHNPDHDTLIGGSFYCAKWGAALGVLSRFLICPDQLKNPTAPCNCSLNTNLKSGLAWTCAGAALGATVGYIRSTLLDENHNLECAEELLELTPCQKKLVNLAHELTTLSSDERDNLYKRVSTIHPDSDYPLVHSHCDFKSIRTRFLRIETYLKRALKNEELDYQEIALIGDLMHNTKKIIYAVEEMLVFISNNQIFTNQLVAQTEIMTIQNSDD